MITLDIRQSKKECQDCKLHENKNKIAELEKENTCLKLKLEALEGETPWKDIKDKSELIKENTELKDDNKVMADNYSKMEQKFYDNLNKAKELIENIIRVTWGEGWNYSLDWKVKAEKFLNSEVVK